MVQVTIYTSMFCGYCVQAKQLLKNKQVEFEEIDLSSTPERRGEMVDRAGGVRTTPQIFIGVLILPWRCVKHIHQNSMCQCICTY